MKNASVTLSKSAKKDNKDALMTEYERAMATLCASGWLPMDAFIVIYGVDPSISEDYYKERVRKITSARQYGTYYKAVRERFEAVKTTVTVEKQTPRKSREPEIDLSKMSKEDVLREMQKTINALDIDNPKRVDVLARYADLEQMKKEEPEEDKEFVHFYLPSKCSSCPLKIKDDMVTDEGPE